ncbi:MAG: hypothetical protein J0M03_17690 [Acidobacteria bacterium]|nr:hypothetical protein [Acidobacteriota bacterium]
MKKLAHVLILTLCFGILVPTNQISAYNNNNNQERHCDRGSGFGTGQFTSPTTAEGVINIRIDRTDYYVTANVTILSLIPQADGSLVGTATHTLKFYRGSALGKFEGTITTSDNAVFTPTSTPGVYTLYNNARISNGTGKFRRAVGGFEFTGTADFVNGTTATPITAVICDC